MLGLRLERLAASLILSSLLLIPRGAVSDVLADADKHVLNVETVRPPAEGDSQPATVHSVGSDAKTAPIPSTISAPAADDKPGDSTANDKADESSNLAGVARPAPLPTPNADQPLAEPEAARIATPPPASDSDKADTEASPAVVATPAPIPTPNSNQPNMDTSPAVVATPAPTPSPAVVATPTPKANPDTSTTTPEVPAAAGLRPENSQSPAASDNQFEPSTTAIPVVAPSQNPATDASAAIDPDAQVAEQLHNLANGKFDGIIGAERATVDAF